MPGLDPDTALDQVETSPGGRCGTAHLALVNRGLNGLGCAYRPPCGTPRVSQLESALAAGAEIATRPTLTTVAANVMLALRNTFFIICPLVPRRRVHGMTLEP